MFFASNHKSALNHASFVHSAVRGLVGAGSVIAVSNSDITVCSPLGVVEGKKLRLIIDLRELNKHIDTVHFRYDDIKVACSLFEQGDFFFSFDLKSAYHHIDIDPAYYKYLGFEWDGQFYVFASLPFGLCSAPYVFTKVCRALVKSWRARGFKAFMFLDDGAGAAESEQRCKDISKAVKMDIAKSGFLLSEKSRLEPAQVGELLGFVLDLRIGQLSATNRRVEKMFDLL